VEDLRARSPVYSELLDTRLIRLLQSHPPFEPLYQMMAYHFGWLNERMEPAQANHGKRLRPTICFLACESFGSPPEDALPGALAVELVHNFSLVHDDIEDVSLTRRHRPTVWSIWGVPHGVNVGDGLFALAHLALTDAGLGSPLDRLCTRILATACVALCEGQFIDLAFQERPSLSLAQYLMMIGKKTGALFGCAAELGALLGGAPENAAGQLGAYGRTLGEVFQMQDDILGVWGEEAVTGKPASDVRERKLGLPAVIAWQDADASDRARLSALYAGPVPIGEAEECWVRELFQRLGVRDKAAAMAQNALRRAEKLLDEALLPGGCAEHLRRLTEELAQRSR
jgi:geranylgeranyl diphosphate synthase, type I